MSDAKIVTMRPLEAETALASGESWKAEVGRWQTLIRSGALPKHVRTPEMAITLVRMGSVYGWDAMRALRSLFIVDGRPEMSAEAMLSLIREKCPEAQLYPVEMGDERVTIRVCRPPQVPTPIDVTVTLDQFKHLLKKDNWRLYGPDMLWARCVSRVARRIFPDVTAGAYTLGEIEEAEFTVRQPAKRGTVEYVEPPSLDLDQRPETEPEDVPDPAPASEVDTEPPIDADVVGGDETEDEPANDPETVVTIEPGVPLPGDPE